MTKEEIKNYNREYYLKNKENWKKEKRKKYISDYNSKNKEHIKQYKREWYLKNKEKVREKNLKLHQDKYKNNPLFKLSASIRASIRNSLKRKNCPKKSRTHEILGCTFDEFKNYIESKFEPWMNWDNYGNQNGIPTEKNIAWELDHIVPISSAITEEDLIRLNHYTNFQPLCIYTNRWIKREKITNAHN